MKTSVVRTTPNRTSARRKVPWIGLAVLAAVPLIVEPAAADIRAPVDGGLTMTVVHGYNSPAPYRGYCNIGTHPDHCNHQAYALDFSISNPNDTDIVAPVTGSILWIDYTYGCIGQSLGGDNNLVICHLSSFDVGVGQNVNRGQRLGTRSSGHVHMSIYELNSSGYKVPRPFTGGWTIEGRSFPVYADNWENYHLGISVTSTNW